MVKMIALSCGAPKTVNKIVNKIVNLAPARSL
jgi:hypothetical protein